MINYPPGDAVNVAPSNWMHSAVQWLDPRNLDGLLIVLVNAELLRENKRMLDKSIREIERERQGLQAQEKKLINEIKKVAKQGQMVCAISLVNLATCICEPWYYSNLASKKS